MNPSVYKTEISKSKSFVFSDSPVNKGRKKANVGTNSNKAGFFPDVRL